MIALVAQHPNLVVIRSLTKLFGVAGLRLGYAIAQPDRLKRWKVWRDPWPVNGIAAAFTEQWLGRPGQYKRWCSRVQRWTASQGVWMQRELARVPGITPMPSAANFLLISVAAPWWRCGKLWSTIIEFCFGIVDPLRGWVRHGFALACNRLVTTAVLFEPFGRFSA